MPNPLIPADSTNEGTKNPESLSRADKADSALVKKADWEMASQSRADYATDLAVEQLASSIDSMHFEGLDEQAVQRAKEFGKLVLKKDLQGIEAYLVKNNDPSSMELNELTGRFAQADITLMWHSAEKGLLLGEKFKPGNEFLFVPTNGSERSVVYVLQADGSFFPVDKDPQEFLGNISDVLVSNLAAQKKQTLALVQAIESTASLLPTESEEDKENLGLAKEATVGIVSGKMIDVTRIAQSKEYTVERFNKITERMNDLFKGTGVEAYLIVDPAALSVFKEEPTDEAVVPLTVADRQGSHSPQTLRTHIPDERAQLIAAARDKVPGGCLAVGYPSALGDGYACFVPLGKDLAPQAVRLNAGYNKYGINPVANADEQVNEKAWNQRSRSQVPLYKAIQEINSRLFERMFY